MNISNIRDNQEFYREIDKLFENQNKLYFKLIIIKQNDKFIYIQSENLFIHKNVSQSRIPWVEDNWEQELDILIAYIEYNEPYKFLVFNIGILYEI